MITRFILPLLAVIGFAFGVFSAVKGNQPAPVAPPAVQPAQSPFTSFIAGAGIVEAESRNINIGTPIAGIVTKIAVKVGDQVKVGTPLFYLDDRDTQAQLVVKRADVVKARAQVAEAEARWVDTRTLLRLAESVSDRRAISTEELDKRRNANKIAKAGFDSANAGLQQAESELASVNTTLQRLIVRAPIDGEVLQVNIRLGEFAQASALTTPLLLLGRLDALHVRVDIDENDAWRFDKNGKAVAFLRGNRRFKADLTLAYVEPFIVPKRSLTGDTTERVDTRVLQVLYRFDRNQVPAYVGQQMDVYIEAPDFDKPEPVS